MVFSSNKRVLRTTAIALLFAGIVLILIGAWMKITEQTSADILLATGFCAKLFGIVLVVVSSPRMRSVPR